MPGAEVEKRLLVDSNTEVKGWWSKILKRPDTQAIAPSRREREDAEMSKMGISELKSSKGKIFTRCVLWLGGC